jgi:HlyD family type I secretion membrane fusion protein
MSFLKLGRKQPTLSSAPMQVMGEPQPMAAAPMPAAYEDWSAKVKTDSKDISGLGTKAGLLALFGFLAWGAFVPIDSAVQAQGTVIAQGRNKVLQHKVGGFVRKIHAVEGQKVNAGDPLIELEPSIDKAQLSQFRTRYATFAAMRRRLEAERGISSERFKAKKSTDTELIGAGDITNSTTTPADPAADTAFDEGLLIEQQREYEKGRDAVAAEIAALKDRAEGQRRTRAGIIQREASTKDQVQLLSKQKASLQRLVAKDAIPKQRLWEVENQLLDRKAELDRLRAEKDSIANAITEIESNIAIVRSKDARTTSEKLTEVMGSMGELKDQIVAAEQSLKDTVIRAPATGTLTAMTVVTEGGVVPPGEIFAEIVPEGAATELLARVRPEDISYVHIGQEAEMLITALNARLFNKVAGQVVYIAADATEDRRTGERYFEVRGKLDTAAMQKISGVAITPGMNGQVFLKGPRRPFLSYVLQPIRDGIVTAFKEPH